MVDFPYFWALIPGRSGGKGDSMADSFRVRAASVLVLSALVLAACSGQDRITSAEVKSALPPTSPQNVLQNIAYAYQTLDFDLYRNQFDPALKLDLGPPAQQYLDEQPDYEWDMESTGNLFADAEWITFEMMIDPPRPSTVEGYPADQGFMEIKAYDVNIEVQPRRYPDDTWLVSNEEAVFVLKKDASVDPAEYKVIFTRYLGETSEPPSE